MKLLHGGDSAEYLPLQEVTREDRRRELDAERTRVGRLPHLRRHIDRHIKKLRAFEMDSKWAAEFVMSRFPILNTLVYYKDDWRGKLAGDAFAGITIGAMIIPQAISYAAIAGMPPVYGLYSSLAPMIMYMILGTSQQLNVAPVAIVSLLVNRTLLPLVDAEDTAAYVSVALFMSFLTGIIFLAFGLLRIGFLFRFLSPAVVSGFVSASAINIGTSQVPGLFGLKLPQYDYFWQTIYHVCENLPSTAWLAFVIGFPTIFLVYFLRKWKPRVPWPLIFLLLETLIGWLLTAYNDAHPKLPVVGTVPRGLPGYTSPIINGDIAVRCIGGAFTIVVIGFMESITLAKILAEKNGYKINYDQELIAVGSANFVGSFFGSYPTTGSFSRSAECDNCGGRTVMYNLPVIILVIFSLLFLTPVFEYIPKTTLSAIVIAAIIRLVDIEAFQHYWRTSMAEFIVAMFSFLVTLGAGTENGVAASVVFSFAVHIFLTSRPHTIELGEVRCIEKETRNERTLFLNTRRFPQAKANPAIPIIRFDAILFYANADYVLERAERLTINRKDNTSAPPFVVFDGSAIISIDLPSVASLRLLNKHLIKAGTQPLWAVFKSHVKDMLVETGAMEELGHDNFFFTVEDAYRHAQRSPEAFQNSTTDPSKDAVAIELDVIPPARVSTSSDEASIEQITV